MRPKTSRNYRGVKSSVCLEMQKTKPNFPDILGKNRGVGKKMSGKCRENL